ncbi:hypothetical protein [Legionella resiliens]|uniref:Uncharacterized protein n=1 Tax=Legionella resiliens TaxID=2905958 RepID=A0ABS8X486_9GAMM|nr:MULTISPECIES: hypothetical protein [unclassified Legionella]MCE0723167.1 hypothetical protein [Legionella sp. 9fVS26]MCE3532320.1 hypothetical protein [Legionella sp. 8cVS16]
MFTKLLRSHFSSNSARPSLSRFAIFATRNQPNGLLIGSNLQRTIDVEKSVSLEPEPIDPEKMRPLEDSSKEDQYELMFATKPGLPIPHLPISHSAIALKNWKDGSFSVYGRQSPWDFSKWLRDGVTFHTQKDNEKKYLSKGYNFIGYPTGVTFSQVEINKFLDSADRLINQNQMCNMYRSNCYSYSTTALSFAIETLLERPHFNSKDVSGVITVLEQHPLQDHFSIGVQNNPVVVDKLRSVLSSVQNRITLLKTPSKTDKQLAGQIDTLLARLGNESREESTYSIGGFI